MFKMTKLNNIKKIIFLTIFPLLAVSCSGGNYFGYQAAPAEYKVWVKRGVSEVETKKIILECGRSPDISTGYGSGTNYYVLFSLCMRASGFGYYGLDQEDEYDKLRKIICNPKLNLTACLPGTTPPKRNVEQRLYSEYCRYKSNREKPECQP
jgi:hypothetical protein